MEWNEKYLRRNRRRSFACSDELWKRMMAHTIECVSVSKFIRDAIKKALKEK